MTEETVIFTEDLKYQYPETTQLGLNNINLNIPKGSKWLLVGPNGAGKSTLLKVLAGKKLIKSGKLRLFNIDPFDLRVKGLEQKTIVYLGTEWANNEIIKRDIGVEELINSVGGNYYIDRRNKLIELLEINKKWRMCRCSDGQRRRVQLCMGLLKPFDLLLLDEVTIDLDVLIRDKLLKFLSNETIERGAVVIYATHIFDGLGDWSDKILHIVNGSVVKTYNREEIKYEGEPGVVQRGDNNNNEVKIGPIHSLHPLALQWLQTDHDEIM